MGVCTVSIFVILGVCGCFVPNSRASELKDLSIVGRIISPSFSVDNASAEYKKKLPSQNESEKGKLAKDSSDEEARASIRVLREIMARFFEEHVRFDLRNLLQGHTKPENHQRLGGGKSLLQDHGDPYMQQTGAADLAGVLSANAYNIGTDHVEGSENKQVDLQMDLAWMIDVVMRSDTKELTAKQAQLYVSLFKHSENDVTKLVVLMQKSDEGKDVVERFMLLMAADSFTRDRAFRLQILRGETIPGFLNCLIYSQRQDLISLPLNVWLEFVAFSRYFTTISDRREFAEGIFTNLEKIVGISGPTQKKMFTAIVEKEAFNVDLRYDPSRIIKGFEWKPEDRDVSRRFENNFISDDDKTALTDALQNEAVVELFGAMDFLNEDHVRAEIEKDPKVDEHLQEIFKDYHNFKLFKENLRDNQVTMLAEELLQFIDL